MTNIVEFKQKGTRTIEQCLKELSEILKDENELATEIVMLCYLPKDKNKDMGFITITDQEQVEVATQVGLLENCKYLLQVSLGVYHDE